MMNKEEKIVNGYYQSNIKTSRNEDSVYAMKYASQQMLIDDLQQRITRAIDYIRENTELYPFNEDGEGGGLALMDYGVQGLLEILGGKE